MPSGYDVGQLVAEIWVDTSEMNAGIQDSKKILSSLEGTLEGIAKNSVTQTQIMSQGFKEMANGSIHHLDAILDLTTHVKNGFVQMGNAMNQSLSNSNQHMQQLSSGFTTLRVGIDQCVVELRNLNNAMNNLHPPANITNIVNSFNNATGSMNNASRSSEGFLLKLSHISLYSYILYQDLRFLGNALTGIFAPGLKFAKEMETTLIGMAGIISSSMQFQGQDIEFNTALQMSQSILHDMKKEALSSTATLKELMETFQAVLGPATALGMSIKEIKDFTVFGVSAVKSLGLNHGQLVQELRSIVGQSITVRGSTVATALGITNSQIEEAKSKVGGVFAFLKERMTGFQLAAKANAGTISGMLSNLEDGLEQAQERAFEGLIKKVHDELGKVQKLFFDIKEYEKDMFNDDGKKIHSQGDIQEAKLNPATVDAFKKMADVAEIAYDGLVRIGTAIAPLVSALGNLAYNGFILLANVISKVLDLLSPFLSLIGSVLVSAIDTLSSGLDYLNSNSLAQLGIALALITATFLLLSSSISTGLVTFLLIATAFSDLDIRLRILAGTLAIVSGAWLILNSNIIKALASSLTFLLANPVLLAVVVVVDLLAVAFYAMSVASEDCAQFVIHAWEAVKAGFATIVSNMEAKWFGFISRMMGGIADMKKSLKDVPLLGKAISEESIAESLNAQADAANKSADAVGNATESFATYNAESVAMRKNIEGITTAMKNSFIHIAPLPTEHDTPQWLKDMMEGVTKKFPNAEKPEKGAGKAQHDAEKQSMAESEAIGKELIAQLKEKQKELDYIYEEGIISVESYYNQTKDINARIMQVERDMLQAKRDITSDKAQQIKIDGEIARLDEEYKIKSIDLDRKRLKEYKTFYKEMASLHRDYNKLSKNNIVTDGMEETYDKYSKQMLRIEQFANGMMETKGGEGVTEEQKKAIDIQLDGLRKSKKEIQEIVTIKYGELALEEALNQIKSKEAQNIAPIRQQIQNDLNAGILTEYEAKQKIYDLDKKKLEELMPLYEKQYAYFEAMWKKTGDSKYLTSLQQLKQEVLDLQHTLPAFQTELKKTFRDNLASALSDAVTGAKSLTEAISSISDAVKKAFVKKFTDKIANDIANNTIPEDKKKDPFSDEKSQERIKSLESEFEKKGEVLYNTFYDSAIKVDDTIAKTLIPSFINLSKVIDNIVNGRPISEGTSSVKTDNVSTPLTTGEHDTYVPPKPTKSVTDVTNKFDNLLGGMTRFGGALSVLTGSDGLLKFAVQIQSINSILNMVRKAQGAGGGIGGFFSSLFGFAEGGLIGGAGSGKTDSNLIKASRGEYMIQYDAVKKFGVGFFDQLNHGRLPSLPAYASGGQIGGSSNSSYQQQQVPNIKIELINQTGTQAEASVGDVKFNGEEYVISMWLTGVSKNLMGSRDMMKGMR